MEKSILFFDVPKNVKPSYMVFPIFLNPNLKIKKKIYQYDRKKGITNKTSHKWIIC